jgi:hypothetical protein
MKHANGGAAVLVVVILVLTVAPLLYVASVGPAAGLVSRGLINGEENSVAATVYSPLQIAYARFEPIQPALDWYISLWSSPVLAPPGPAPAYAPTPPSLAPANKI